MLVLADNDILIKLAGCSLLERFLEILDNPPVYIAQTTRYSLPKQAQRQITDPRRAENLCRWLDKTQNTPVVNDLDLLDKLSAINGIDSGEAKLFATMYEAQQPMRLMTGDKRALQALIARQSELPEVFSKLSGTVYTLESALLFLIEQCGFPEIDEIMRARAVKDSVINMSFGHGRNSDHAKQCLSSHTRHLLPLLANPHLLLPEESNGG